MAQASRLCFFCASVNTHRRDACATGSGDISLGVKKKNILLTIWLALPITIVSLLMVWIFYSLDKDRLMDDAVPYGAGAGDTGNANAIGEWLAGNDADAISLAVKARREGLAIDPRDWPGGVEIRVQIPEGESDTPRLLLTLIHDEIGRYTTSGLGDSTDGWFVKRFDQEQLKGSRFVISRSFPSRSTDGFVDDTGDQLRVVSFEPQIPDPNLQTSEPMVVEIRMGSVYEDPP